MADLANLLGGYGSGSEDEDGSMGDAAGALASADGVVVRSRDSRGAAPAGGTSPGAIAAAGAAPLASTGDEAAAPPSPSGQHHVMEGPSTNPEPPPEGLSPPVVAPAASGSSGGGGGERRPDPLLMLPPELRERPASAVDPVILEKVALIDSIQRQKGVTVLAQLSKDRRYNNPTFLDKMVAHFELDPYGTCFRPEVWDPKALPEEDTWKRLDEELKAAAGRRAEEAQRRETVQFQSGGLQAPAAPYASGGLAAAGARAPIGFGAATAAAAAAAKAAAAGAGAAVPPRAPAAAAVTDPRIAQAQALAQALAAKVAPPAGGASAAPAPKRTKWDA